MSRGRRMVAVVASAGALGAAAVASAATGTLATVAGESGAAHFGGDGGPAIAATLSSPQMLVRAPDGALLVSDWVDQVVRRIDPRTGVIKTIAGTPGVASASPTAANGDGGPATAATLNRPSGLAFLGDGTLLIADAGNNRIRAIHPATRVITTVAGTGGQGSAAGSNGDGGAAAFARLAMPLDVATLANGKDFLIADTGDNRIRRVNTDSGKIYAFAGSGESGRRDDDDLDDAEFTYPQALSSADGSTWLVADRFGPTIRRIGARGVTTVAGRPGVTGTPESVGDGGPATAASLDLPADVAALPDGGFYVSDANHFRIRRVWPDGSISTVVGTGQPGYDGDGDLATGRIHKPVGLLPDADGSLLFVDWWADGLTRSMRIRRAVPATAGGASTGTGAAPDVSPGVDALGPRRPLPAPAPPRAGERVGLESASGAVYVRLPGAGSAVRLDAASSVPVGSVVDATRGRVELTSARSATGTRQTGVFSGGRFRIDQRRANGYVTELHLVGGSFAGCPRPRRSGSRSTAVASAAAARRSRRSVVRRLWGKDSYGRFQTHGRNSVATVRGTRWVTVDRCDGTLTRVTSGAVKVRDRRGRSVLVRAGERHLARAAR